MNANEEIITEAEYTEEPTAAKAEADEADAESTRELVVLKRLTPLDPTASGDQTGRPWVRFFLWVTAVLIVLAVILLYLRGAQIAG